MDLEMPNKPKMTTNSVTYVIWPFLMSINQFKFEDYGIAA